jgi:hypothetical protein
MSTAEAQPSEQLEPVQRTTVELDHWLFKKLEGVRFHLNQSTFQPGLSITMAKNEAFLSLASVRKEFAIDTESPDGQMLAKIADALKYVKGLLIGDPLPKEVLTGEASWQVTPRHIAIAQSRVALKLVMLVSTDQPTTNDPAELLALADDPEIKKKINESFSVAAVELGMKPEQKQEVIEYVNQLAGELAYLEALRDKFGEIVAMRDKTMAVRKICSSKPTLRETADQVARLMERAKNEYQALFDDVDSRTAEVLPMLRTLGETIELIRKLRDDLYVRFRVWDDLLKRWAEGHVEYSMKISDLLRDTHMFLAPRFMSFTDWTAQAREEQKKRSKLKIQPMTW